MKFKKPPVVEAWIAFKFDLSEEATEWNEDTAEYFIKKHFEDFKIEGVFGFSKIFVDNKTRNIDPDKTQIIFDRIRAFTEQKNYCVQVGRDKMIFNQIKKGMWPGYEVMRDQAVGALKKYMDFRGLYNLSNVSLHYRDIISIPKDREDRIDLKDFFRVYPEMPEETFSIISAFNFSTQLEEFCEKATTTLTLQSLPLKDLSEGNFKFAMDWHITSVEKFEDLNHAIEWLDTSHKNLRDGFESVFTKKCLAIFEPEGSK